jgi:hypothetical protein
LSDSQSVGVHGISELRRKETDLQSADAADIWGSRYVSRVSETSGQSELGRWLSKANPTCLWKLATFELNIWCCASDIAW